MQGIRRGGKRMCRSRGNKKPEKEERRSSNTSYSHAQRTISGLTLFL